jgi:predicted amidophosphoribosyltransferase
MYIAKELNAPCVNLCTKQEHTRSQTAFSREQRKKNQENMFLYTYTLPLPPEQIILVVDDVLTT